MVDEPLPKKGGLDDASLGKLKAKLLELKAARAAVAPSKRCAPPDNVGGPLALDNEMAKECHNAPKAARINPVSATPLVESDTTPALALEVCCGSGTYGLELKRQGFKVLGIDHSANQHKPVIKTTNIDLRRPRHRAKLWQIIKEQK